MQTMLGTKYFISEEALLNVFTDEIWKRSAIDTQEIRQFKSSPIPDPWAPISI